MTEAAKLAIPNHRDYHSIIRQDGDGFDAAAAKDALRQVSGKSYDETSKGNSVLVTAGVIIGDTLGAGLLTMPGALSMFGWFAGSIFIVGMLALNLHICMLLWRMRMAFPQAHTLGELAEASFSRAPRWQRSLMRQVTDCVQYMFVFFLLSADATSLGKGFGLLFYDVHLCLPVWVLIGSVILLPVHARTRSLGGNKLSIAFNCVAVTCCVGLCLRHFAHQGVLTSRGADATYAAVTPMSALGVLNGLNIMMFNFTIQFMVVEIASEMEKPEEFPRALWGYAFPFLAALFTLCGMGGYYYLGDKANGLLIGHLPFGMSLRLTAACLVFLVLIAYLLKSVVLCKTIHTYCDPEHAGSGSTRSEAGYTLTIVFVLGAAFLVSQVVPFFTPFIDLIGATLAPLCCVVIPLVMYSQWHCTFGGRTDLAERALILLEVALCVLIMTLGTYDSLLTIVRGWEEFGAPFSCHCELLWDTCGCSASKPGMSLCSPHYGWLDQAVSLYADSLGLSGGLESIRRGEGTYLWWY
jgi:amino acid permease